MNRFMFSANDHEHCNVLEKWTIQKKLLMFSSMIWENYMHMRFIH